MREREGGREREREGERGRENESERGRERGRGERVNGPHTNKAQIAMQLQQNQFSTIKPAYAFTTNKQFR